MSAPEERPEWPERGALRVLNHDLVRVDGPDKVAGRARYAHDMRLPGMVWARIVTCPYPAAQVAIDLVPAQESPGVVDARGLLEGDDALEGETRYLGQPIAVVTAETPELAADGARALGLSIEPLEWSVTRDQALDSLAPEISRRGNRRENKIEGDRETAEIAIDEADVVIRATYTLPVQHHVCLETHGVVADARGDEATVWASSQAVDFVAQQAARELRLKEPQVEAVVDYMGGGFGSKFQIGVEGAVACAVSRDLERPVHLMLDRRQEFEFGGNRSGSRQKLRAGARADGRLVGLTAEIERYGGIGRGSHPGQPYIYSVEGDAWYQEDHSVLTNMDSNRAMRAPGHPQASFAIESLIDETAYALGLDPLAVRKVNLADPVYHRQLDRAAREIGWDEHPHKTDFDKSDAWTKRGIGFGVSTWGGGGRAGCGAEVRISADGGVEVRVAVQDLGTGVRTMVAAIVAEELGLDVSDVTGRVGRSSYPPGVGSGGSVTTGSVSPPVKEAAHKARVAFLARVGEALGRDPADLAIGPHELTDSSGARVVSWIDACARLGPDGLVAQSEPRTRDTWGEISHLQDSGVHGAQAAEVEVDTLTGRVQVLRMVCVQDCGLPMNRLALRSQLNGGVIQALSFGLFEERVVDPDLGLLISGDLESYKVAGSLEIPEIVSLIDDEDTRSAPIGIGEPPVIPGHAAIANAIYNACGVRLRDMPFTPDRVLMGLEALRAQGGGK